jgi:hypothetical protein
MQEQMNCIQESFDNNLRDEIVAMKARTRAPWRKKELTAYMIG